MIVARHRSKDIRFVEAYDAGIGLPLLRGPDGTWAPDEVDAAALWDDWADVVDPAERAALLAEARAASAHFEMALAGMDIESLTLRQIKQQLAMAAYRTSEDRTIGEAFTAW